MKTLSMRLALVMLVMFSPVGRNAYAQAPSSGAKPGKPPQPITAKDVRVIPFAREFEEKSLEDKRGYPDELRVATTTNKVHLSGKKRVEQMKVEGRLVCHSGKLALLAPADRSGKLTAKVPTADDVTYYYATIELADGTLSTKTIKLEERKTYDWSYKAEGGQSTLRVADGAIELAAVKVPSDRVKGYGFASTVRWKNNESDLEFTIE